MATPYLFDLLHALRTDPVKGPAIRSAVDALARIEQAASEGKAGMREISEVQSRVVASCGMNFGLLAPYIITKFGRRGQPMSLLDRPFMFSMTCLAPNTTVTLRAGRQVGKCADGETVVDTNHGPRTLEELFASGQRVDE